MAIVIYILEILFFSACVIGAFGFVLYSVQWVKRNKQYMSLDNAKKKKKFKEKFSVFNDKKIIDGAYKEKTSSESKEEK